jgi:peptide/nickel transport system permease protein
VKLEGAIHHKFMSKIWGPLKIPFGNRSFSVGFAMFLVMLVVASSGRLLSSPDLLRVGHSAPSLPPSLDHLLGTDVLGRDISVQLYGAILNSLKIGLIAATVGTAVGALIGFVAGYYGGITDSVLRVLTDVFLSVPSLMFLVLISALVRVVSIEAMAMIIALFAWAWPARQIRAQALSLKEREFVYMAKLSGMGNLELVIRELMPHMLQWMIANFVNAYLSAILTESGLSILGLGPQVDMTLGMMLWWALNSAAMYRGIWWWWGAPVFVLIYSFFSLYLMHAGLDELINPRLRGR